MGDCAEEQSLRILRGLATEDDLVAVFENSAMDSAGLGQRVFLLIGKNRMFKSAPKHAPDGAYGLGWKYPFVGYLDLLTNELKPLTEPKEKDENG